MTTPTQSQSPIEVQRIMDDIHELQDPECPMRKKCFQTNCLNCKGLK